MDIFSHPSLAISTMFATMVYAFMGIVIMLIAVVVFDKLFNLDLRKELIQDENTAFGILLAGVAMGISIIIAASIVG